jgi:hypothetical protein
MLVTVPVTYDSTKVPGLTSDYGATISVVLEYNTKDLNAEATN